MALPRSSSLDGIQLHLAREERRFPHTRTVTRATPPPSATSESTAVSQTTLWRVVVVITLLEISCVSIPLLVTCLRLTTE